MGIKEVVDLLTSVGFGSPPAWLRPFRVLSNGEQFRVMVARAIAETTGLIAIDEFTSVVDRQVAKVASHTVQKAIRRRKRQLIAVSCHYDIIEWLQPDWVYQPHTRDFARRRLRRHPDLQLTLHPINKAVWSAFKQYHYMSSSLATGARCIGGFIDGQCVAFASWRHFPHPKARNIMQGHRLVVLPDYQGLGIGGRMDDWIGQYLYDKGYRYHNVIAHPAMIAYYSRSPRWTLLRAGRQTQKKSCATIASKSRSAVKSLRRRQFDFSTVRNSHTFVYTPPKPEA